MRPLLPGDIIVYDGGDTSDLVEVVTHFLSNGIKFVTRSKLSHASMIWPFSVPINGAPQTELHVIQSTINGRVNGVQLTPLADTVASHARSWALCLNAVWRRNLDFGAMWKLGAGMLDHDKYNVIEIGEYLARHIPLIQELPVLSQSIPGMEVCSELDAILLRAGGLPGLHPALTSPQVLAELRIYDECVQLAGPPEAIPGFNTV